jgi:hypothetical protein
VDTFRLNFQSVGRWFESSRGTQIQDKIRTSVGRLGVRIARDLALQPFQVFEVIGPGVLSAIFPAAS